MDTPIKTLRERAGITQAELATAAGVSQQAVQQWEAGRSAPKGERLTKVAAALGIDTHTLRTGAPVITLNPDNILPAFRQTLHLLLEAKTPGQIDQTITAPTGMKWQIDYLAGGHALNIMPGGLLTPEGMPYSCAVAHSLIQLASYKAFSGAPCALVLVAGPAGYAAQIGRQRLTLEAALLGVAVFECPTPEDLPGLLMEITK